MAGYSHSGSTLLDVILSSSDNIVGLGEVSRAEEEKERRYFRIEELDDEYKEWWENALFGDVSSKLDERVGEGDTILGVMQGGGGRFGKEFFVRSAVYFGVDYCLDSSKTTPINLLRPMYLKSDGLSVLVLHLLRDPISILKSYYRRGVTNIFSVSYISIKWAVSTILTFCIYKGGRYLNIDFRKLMEEPVSCLEDINESFNLPVDEAIHRLENGTPFDQGGGFLGNGMRRQKKIYFNPSESEIKTPFYIKVLGGIFMPIYYILARV